MSFDLPNGSNLAKRALPYIPFSPQQQQQQQLSTQSITRDHPDVRAVRMSTIRKIVCISILVLVLVFTTVAWLAVLYTSARNDTTNLRAQLNDALHNSHHPHNSDIVQSNENSVTITTPSGNATVADDSDNDNDESWDAVVGAMLYSSNPDTGLLVAPVDKIAPNTCPIGFHDKQTKCALNIAPGNDIDETLMDPSADICVDPEMYANGRWVMGYNGNRPPWPSRTWDTITHSNEMMLATIQRTEMQKIWGREDIQQMVTECVRTRSLFFAAIQQQRHSAAQKNVYIRIAAVVDAIVPTRIATHKELVRIWGRLAAFGAVHPLYTSVERKHPADHTRRLVFVQQAGLLGGAECVDLAVVYGRRMSSEASEAGRMHLEMLQELARIHDMPAHTAYDILRLERVLCNAHVQADTPDYVRYVQYDIDKDIVSYSQLAETLGAALPLDAYYTGMAETHGMNETLLVQAMHETEHWVLRLAYFANLARVTPTISLDTWTAYCRISMLYEIDSILVGSQDGTDADNGADDASRARTKSIIDKIHLRERKYINDKTGSASVRPRGLNTGFNIEWLMPSHPIRKPLWHASSKSSNAVKKIPASYRAPLFLKSAMRSEQESASLRDHETYVMYAESCALDIYQTMPDHLDRMFTEIVSKMVDMPRIATAVDTLRKIIETEVMTSDFSRETKRVMIAKLHKVRIRIGSQDFVNWHDPASILAGHLTANPFSTLASNPENIDTDATAIQEYVQTVLLLRRASIYYYTGWIHLAFPVSGNSTQSVDQVPFSMPASVANAWYSPQDPSLNIAAGIMTNPLYDNRFSHQALYAKLITVVAHEFAHMFDDSTGIYFDEYGNVNPWMGTDDKTKWAERVECVVTQFSARTRHMYRHNGRATIGEAMADSMAINWAYHALQIAHPSPASANITAFALMYAQVWADVSSPASDRNRIANDEHPVPEFRVNKVLENFVPFAAQVCNRPPKCIIFKSST